MKSALCCLFLACCGSGCQHANPLAQWPADASCQLTTAECAQAWAAQVNFASARALVVGMGAELAPDNYTRLGQTRVVAQPTVAQGVAKQISSVPLSKRPWFTVTPPIYVVLLDEHHAPVVAVMINDGVFQPVIASQDERGWKTKRLFKGEAQKLRGSVGDWEPYLRAQIRW